MGKHAQLRLYACALLAAAAVAAHAGDGKGKGTKASKAAVRKQAAGRQYGEKLILGGRKGDLRDLKKANPPNIAKGCYPKPLVRIDASSLKTPREHFTRASRFFKVKADSDYTLLFEVQGEGEGYVSAGVRWKSPDAPPGLVDKEEFMTVLKVPRKWTERSFTFTSDPDPKSANMQVLLKAHGSVKASFRNVRLVEGWWAETKWRFKRPYGPGERKW